MTRTVLDNAMVAHVWAQQEQSEGRSGNGNFYFRGTAIYSYRDSYPVGNFVRCPDGEMAVLLWDGTYSVTTSAHQRYARDAVRGQRCFTVPDLLVGHHGDMDARVAANLMALTERAKATMGEIRKAAGTPNMNPRDYLLDYDLPNQIEVMRDYCRAFKLRIQAPARGFDLETFKAELAAIRERAIAERDAARARKLVRFGGDAEAMAAHEARSRTISRANAVRKALDGVRHWLSYDLQRRSRNVETELADLVEADASDATAARHLAAIRQWLAGHQERTAREQEERAAREAEHRAEYARQQAARAAFEALSQEEQRAEVEAGRAEARWLDEATRLELWRAGSLARFSTANYGFAAALRLRPGDQATVETSQGATFPVEHARQAWRALRAIYARGTAWQSNGHTIPLGHFRISNVDVHGTITAGCHMVTRAEAERFAVDVLGLPAVDDSTMAHLDDD